MIVEGGEAQRGSKEDREQSRREGEGRGQDAGDGEDPGRREGEAERGGAQPGNCLLDWPREQQSRVLRRPSRVAKRMRSPAAAHSAAAPGSAAEAPRPRGPGGRAGFR